MSTHAALLCDKLCDETRALLPDYLRRRLPPVTLAAVRAHLVACAECAAAFEAERDFSALIGGTDTAPPPALMLSVMAKIRQEPRPVAFRLSGRDALLALAGTAAIFGMFFGLLSLAAVLPPLAALTAGGLGLPDTWLALAVSLLVWVVPGLVVAALVGATLYGALTGHDRGAEPQRQ